MAQDVTIRWNGDAASAQMDDALMRGLAAGGEYLLGEAVELVPLDEGTLMQSGNVTVDAANQEVIVGFDTEYAVEQHEELDYEHAPGRQAKYLEEPANTKAQVIFQVIARVAKANMP